MTNEERCFHHTRQWYSSHKRTVSATTEQCIWWASYPQLASKFPTFKTAWLYTCAACWKTRFLSKSVHVNEMKKRYSSHYEHLPRIGVPATAKCVDKIWAWMQGEVIQKIYLFIFFLLCFKVTTINVISSNDKKDYGHCS